MTMLIHIQWVRNDTMEGRRPTYREIEETVVSLVGEVRSLKRAVEERDRTI